MYPPPWKGCEELLVMPFSDACVSCVSSCVVLRDATLSSSKPFTLVAAGTFFFLSSPSLSLSSEEDEDDDDDDEEPEEQEDEEEEELDPECDEEDDEEEEEEEERDEELEEEPSESDSEPRRASRRPLLLAFLGFLSEELGVRGLVRAATICLSLSLASQTGFSSRPVGVAGAGGGLQLSPCLSLPSSPSEAGSTLGTTPQDSVSL